MTSIVAKGLTVAYPETQATAIQDVNVTFSTGRRTAIIGRNGAGKSTLLKAILGLVPLESGTVSLGSHPLDLRSIAYVPQRSAVDWSYPISVRDVVMMGQPGWAAWLPFSSHKSCAAAQRIICDLGLNGLETKPIGALSGGQQQRVFLARALMQQAQFYLFDEPLAGLDVTTTQVLTGIFASLAKSGAAVVAVHHDLSTVSEMFDDVVLVNRRLVACGAVEQTITSESIAAAYAAASPFGV